MKALNSPSLFSFDFSENAFVPGEIVRQAWPWVLCERGSKLMPFWQVHHVYHDGQKRIVYCHAVPFTTGCGEMYGFSEEDLERTGKYHRPFSFDEVKALFEDLGVPMAVCQINGIPPVGTHPKEAELLALLADLGPIKIPNRKGEFYAQFPNPTLDEWRARKWAGL